MTTDIPDVLADPVGAAVALITGIEPGLDPALAGQAVMSVADGRAKRRKLAQALAQRPAVLADGRSPAPRVVGDLLIALRKAGAAVISPPVCADVRQAAAHAPAPRRGLVLQRVRPPAGPLLGLRPGPGHYQPSTGRDSRAAGNAPTVTTGTRWPSLAATVTAVDPSLTAEAISAAAQRVFSKPAHLQKLAWAIEGPLAC